MKNLRYILIALSVALASASSLSAFAIEKNNKGGHHPARYEHRDDRKNHGHASGNNRHGKNDRKDKHHKDYGRKDHHGTPNQPGFNHNHGNPPHVAPKPHHNNHHPDAHFNKMVRHAIGGGKNAVVWQIGPFEYIVKFKKGKNHYMRRFYTNTGQYGPVSRIVIAGPDEWYLAFDRNRRYRSNGSHLNVYVNGTPLSPWTLIPDIDINVHIP